MGVGPGAVLLPFNGIVERGVRRRPLFAAVALSAVVAWVCACGGDVIEPPPDPPRPTTVAVIPATSELTAFGATVQLRAEVRDQSGNVMGGAAVTWVSSSPAVAAVSGSGLVTAAGNGTATITATAGTVPGTATVTVAQRVSAVAVTPDAGIVLPDTTLQLFAEATDANGHSVASAEFSWASSDTAVAVVDETGLVRGIALGAVEVSAASSGLTARARLEVVAPAPTALAVTPDTVAFEALGDTLRLRADVRDQIGRPMPGELVIWDASDTLVATVDPAGLVTAAGNGTATVAATSGKLSGDAAIEVMQRVRSVTVTPATDTIAPGDTLLLSAEALDANRRLVGDAEFLWSTSDASVAPVDAGGVVRGAGEGAAVITAAAGDVPGTADIAVVNPDRAALAALYEATDGPNWADNDNWLTDAPLWSWYGVHTNAHDRVLDVSLQGHRDSQSGRWTRHGLKGTIPPELGSLTELESLWLYGNELSGTIPPELGRLANLEALDLSDNELTGPIPSELGNLAGLKHLALYTNELSGRIPSALGHLASLETLGLAGNGLTGPVPSELGSLANLKNLVLHDNSLEGTIPPELGSLSRLEILSLVRNRLSGPIPAALGDLGSLKHLQLFETGLAGPIPPELSRLASLESLLLSNNNLTGPIPSGLGNLENLTRLELHENALTGGIPEDTRPPAQARDTQSPEEQPDRAASAATGRPAQPHANRPPGQRSDGTAASRTRPALQAGTPAPGGERVDGSRAPRVRRHDGPSGAVPGQQRRPGRPPSGRADRSGTPGGVPRRWHRSLRAPARGLRRVAGPCGPALDPPVSGHGAGCGLPDPGRTVTGVSRSAGRR